MRIADQKWLGNPFTMINILGMTKLNKLCDGFSIRGVSSGPKVGFLHVMGLSFPVSISHPYYLTGKVTNFFLNKRLYFLTTAVRTDC